MTGLSVFLIEFLGNGSLFVHLDSPGGEATLRRRQRRRNEIEKKKKTMRIDGSPVKGSTLPSLLAMAAFLCGPRQEQVANTKI